MQPSPFSHRHGNAANVTRLPVTASISPLWCFETLSGPRATRRGGAKPHAAGGVQNSVPFRTSLRPPDTLEILHSHGANVMLVGLWGPKTPSDPVYQMWN
jgi:hypothetical protein